MQRKICGAKNRAGQPCKAIPMSNGRCARHGGKTPIGIASPHFKDGKRSKYTAIGLGERIKKAMGDPRLLELRSAVATVDVRIGELVAMLEAAQDGPHPATDPATPTGEEQADLDVGALWEALTQALHDKARLVESESKRLRLLNQYVPAEMFLGFLSFLMQILQQNVTDPRALQTIGAGIQNYGIMHRLGTDQTIDQEVDQEVDDK